MSDTVTFVHSSDLHLGDEETTRASGGNETLMLELVLDAAADAGADAVLLAGDVFDHNRVGAKLVARVGRLLARAPAPVVVLPGNHDPLVADGVWRRAALNAADHVHVLGLGRSRAVHLDHLGLEIWGNAHRHYDNMAPLAAPRRRSGARFLVAMAHGHYVDRADRRSRLQPSWLIGRDEIAATGADYVALGHWNRSVAVGGASGVPAHYSGAPELERTVNLVRLTPGARARVRRLALSLPL